MVPLHRLLFRSNIWDQIFDSDFYSFIPLTLPNNTLISPVDSPFYYFFFVRKICSELTSLPIFLCFSYTRCLHSMAEKWSRFTPRIQTLEPRPPKLGVWNFNHLAMVQPLSLLNMLQIWSLPIHSLPSWSTSVASC